MKYLQHKPKHLQSILHPLEQVLTLLVSVHEIALKRNLQVYFEVVREAGPPHMRTFLTKVIVGDFVTEGEGNGKKVENLKENYRDNILYLGEQKKGGRVDAGEAQAAASRSQRHGAQAQEGRHWQEEVEKSDQGEIRDWQACLYRLYV